MDQQRIIVQESLKKAIPFFLRSLLNHVWERSKNIYRTKVYVLLDIQTYFFSLLDLPYRVPFLHTIIESTKIDTDVFFDYLKKINPDIDYYTLNWSIPSWGPIVWDFLHQTSILVRGNERATSRFRYLLDNLHLIIPCPLCASHYTNLHKEHEFLYADSYFDIVTYVYNIHLLVSLQVSKQRQVSFVPFSPESFQEKYGLPVNRVLFDSLQK